MFRLMRWHTCSVPLADRQRSCSVNVPWMFPKRSLKTDALDPCSLPLADRSPSAVLSWEDQSSRPGESSAEIMFPNSSPNIPQMFLKCSLNVLRISNVPWISSNPSRSNRLPYVV
jgi:hypothetical protein